MTELADFQAALVKVRDRFLSVLPERESSISSLLNEVERGGVCADCVDQAKFALHKIAGTAGTLGYGDLGRAAAACEGELAVYCGTSEGSSELADKLRVVLDLIASAQNSAGR